MIRKSKQIPQKVTLELTPAQAYMLLRRLPTQNITPELYALMIALRPLAGQCTTKEWQTQYNDIPF